MSNPLPVSDLLRTFQAFLALCRFMEFEAEEEMQIQNTQLMNGSQGLPPAASLKLDPPGLLAPEASQQPGKAIQFQIGALGQRLKGRRTQSSHGLGKALPLLLSLSLQGVPLMFQTGHT